ncbi:MAG: hypothetical protein GY769_20890, partial [bacterium]|nr:hypothetical protein [bacterium]
AIIRGAGSVSGLTSAATIWFQGALGILIGCSYPITGILLALVVVALLSVVSGLENWSGKLMERRRRGAEPAGTG